MIVGGLVMLALGAILRFAVTAQFAGVSISAVGLILLIVGGLTLLIGLALRISGNESPASRY
ncbi:MAG TPA: hypothetical protein VKG38_20295 [Solirubrobacteraceae bacterium]|nr:hypothetical protein [Solirubrobacteraceae bacterium]